jgi:TetR/AcrR family transcriptional regulator, cholesterol catabolism regulator
LVAKQGESREQLLDAAEKLFMRKGYGATTLRDISSGLGVSHASLYYHFPGGKETLFEAVTERNVVRHGEGLARSMAEGGGHLHGRLLGAASWLLSQPPMDLIRMAESDMPALPEAVSRRLMELIYVKILHPITVVFESARDSGEVGPATDAGLVAGAFFGLIESLHATPGAFVKRSKMDMATELIKILLKGIDYSEGDTHERG